MGFCFFSVCVFPNFYATLSRGGGTKLVINQIAPANSNIRLESTPQESLRNERQENGGTWATERPMDTAIEDGLGLLPMVLGWGVNRPLVTRYFDCLSYTIRASCPREDANDCDVDTIYFKSIFCNGQAKLFRDSGRRRDRETGRARL